MEQLLVPYEAAIKIEGTRVLVLAPHPDDEVFGCGGAIMRHVADGTPLQVIIVSDGAYRADSVEQSAYAGLRRAESAQAAKVLGYGEPEFWDLPDRGIEYGEFLVRRIEHAIGASHADLIYAPSIYEMHPDHRALGMAAVEAVRRNVTKLKLAMYEVGVPMLCPNLLLDISNLLERKQQAMACFASQLKVQSYDQHIAALNKFRTYTLGSRVTAAEAYFVTQADDLKTGVMKLYESEHQRQQARGLPMTPADVPLVSVLIRSMDRPTLNAALDSVALQTYPHVEVVVVNAKGGEHSLLSGWCGRFPLRLVNNNSEAFQRSRAANAALKEARGQYLIFLDDDDWFAPHHINALVDRIRKEPRVNAVHSNIRVVGALGNFEDHIFREKFDPVRIMADNLIPIHSVLFDACLVKAGCLFDEMLSVYEDWDFWLQVSRHTAFAQVDEVGAYYSASGNSEVGLQGMDDARNRAREQVFEKWKEIWSGREINALLAQKDSLIHTKNNEFNLTVRNLEEQSEVALQTVKEQLNFAIQTLDEKLKNRELALSEQISLVESLSRGLTESNSTTTELKKRIDELLSSSSWRVTAPLRWLGKRTRNLRYLSTLGRRFVKANGGGFRGAWRLLLKALSALRKHGPIGLVYKIKAYARHSGRSVHAFNPIYPASHVNPMMHHGVAPHGQSIDIIICVHNALDDVTRCLESVVSHTFPPYSLILVDDGSSEPTKDFLERFAAGQGAQLIRNATAKGYTLAANQGLRSSTADYSVLLNSDTIVSTQWLDRMVMCAESDNNLGIVGPLSNTASWQSVPDILVNGDWADNELPQNMTINTMAALLAARSARLYPRISLLNGFCLLIKRKLINQIGIFDEESFAKGYGEENDYCLRARQAGWSLAVADDVYIYHAQSKSYSHERRKMLSQQAGEILALKHGQPIINESVDFCRYNRVLEGIRAGLKTVISSHLLRSEGKSRWEGKRVLFFLPTADAGGGSNVIISEAMALISMGIDARLLNYASNQSSFEYGYPDIGVPRVYVANDAELMKIARDFDVVVATVNTTVPTLANLVESTPIPPLIAYYIQDFEPFFYKKASNEYQSSLRSYGLIPGMVHLTKTEWNQRVLHEKTSVECTVIGPSFNTTLFRPRPRREKSWPDRPLRIVAMIRPYTPRRAARLTMEVLRSTYQKYEERIEIVLFGEESEHPDFLSLPLDFQWRNLGKQNSSQLALLFNESDIFVDLSEYQAMGLTAMEAMACGVAVIVPKLGGAASFAVHGENALIIDSSNKAECLNALSKLIEEEDLRTSIQQRAICDIASFSPDIAAYNMMHALFPGMNTAKEQASC